MHSSHLQPLDINSIILGQVLHHSDLGGVQQTDELGLVPLVTSGPKYGLEVALKPEEALVGLAHVGEL